MLPWDEVLASTAALLATMEPPIIPRADEFLDCLEAY